MNHSFDIDVAKDVGVNAAVVFNNFAHWYKVNASNGNNYHDGKYWTFNKRSALQQIFPYMTEKQLRTAIDKLVENDLIEKGNYNEKQYDRTLWYTLTEKGLSIAHIGRIHLPKKANPSALKGQPIPDINPVIETDTITSPADDGDKDGFAEFWELYPRKVAKSAAQKAWRSLRLGDSVKGQVLADLHRRLAGEWSGKDKQYIPHPTTYLHQRRWEDEVEDSAQGTVQDDTVGPFGAWRV